MDTSLITSMQSDSLQKQSSIADQGQPALDRLQASTYLYYSLGHIYNDLGGAMYFNYLFFFLKRVVKTPAASAVFLSGQVTDGAVTPLLGYLCDRFGSRKYGQRTPWYFGGLIIFVLGYAALYQNANRIFGQQISDGWQYFYYISANLLTNLGWASVQIANMSLIPTITYSRGHRNKLNNIRNTRTFTCALSVLIVGAILFSFQEDATMVIFEMSLGFGIIGIICCAIYLAKVKEVELSQSAKECRENVRLWLQNQPETRLARQQRVSSQIDQTITKAQVDDDQSNSQQQEQSQIATLKRWLTQWSFYLFALFFLSSRVYINVSGTFLPFLIVDILQFSQQDSVMPVYITLNSLIITIFQILTTILLPRLTKHYQNLFIYTVTALLSLGIGLLMLLLTPQVKYLVFMFAVLIGITQAILINVSYELMYEVIGDKVKSSGLVIGIYGLLDKCSSGLIVYFITANSIFDTSLTFKRIASCVVPVSFLGLAGILAIWKVVTQKKYLKKSAPTNIRKKVQLNDHVQNLKLNPIFEEGNHQFEQSRFLRIRQIQKDMIF